MLEWLASNWYILIGIIALLAIVIFAIVKFFKLPTSKQIEKVKEWLLYAVIAAEKELGSGTGQLKLRKVYDMFLARFSFLSSFISFETFSKWVDEALEKMKTLLQTNKNIAWYVEGEE